MSLKDQIATDNSKVFLNLDEFADIHMIDGVETKCVCTDDIQNRIKEGRILGNIEADLIVYGLTEELPYDPEMVINIDGREYIVTKASHAMGMTELALRQNLGM